jgi:monoamine oxidase
VIIIGAGAAGLAAAVELGRAGLKIRILEARDRIGGRIFTRHDPVSNAPIELGAEFVHGRPPEIWDLLRHARIKPEEMTGDHWCFRNGRLCACDFFAAVDKLLSKLDDSGPDESFTEFLNRCGSDCDEENKRWAIGYVRGFHAADPGLISVHSLVKGIRADEPIDGERAFHVPEGYAVLIDILRRQLRESTVLDMEMPVEHVEWQPGRVRLRILGHSDVAEASRLLITVPLGVLQADRGDPGYIGFDPELPLLKRTALEQLAMGKVMRLVLRFRERFWDKLRSPDDSHKTLSDMSFLLSQEGFFPTWWTTMPRKLPIITAWAPSSFAEQLSSLSEPEVLGTALQTLSTLFGVELARLETLLESASWHNWQADPFTRGAYSYVKKGGDTAQYDLGVPVENTLFFAGEATDTSGHTGTVHGAIASGRRAANDILRAYEGSTAARQP